MMNLDELTEAALDFAKRSLIGRPGAQLLPCWLIQGAERTTIVATPFDGGDSKDFIALAIRQMLKAERAVSYSFVSEAWRAVEDVKHPVGLTPSQREDRQEIVMIHVNSREGEARMRSWEVIRGPDGVVIELKADSLAGQADRFEGRFFNLFGDSHED